MGLIWGKGGGGGGAFQRTYLFVSVGGLLTTLENTAALLMESTRGESLDTVVSLFIVVGLTMPFVRRRKTCIGYLGSCVCGCVCGE